MDEINQQFPSLSISNDFPSFSLSRATPADEPNVKERNDENKFETPKSKAFYHEGFPSDEAFTPPHPKTQNEDALDDLKQDKDVVQQGKNHQKRRLESI